jgi:hypothetical protein
MIIVYFETLFFHYITISLHLKYDSFGVSLFHSDHSLDLPLRIYSLASNAFFLAAP